jgi:hypothetical protein
MIPISKRSEIDEIVNVAIKQTAVTNMGWEHRDCGVDKQRRVNYLIRFFAALDCACGNRYLNKSFDSITMP